jgi:ABC-type multidrug transport system ATPase subunit
MSPVVYRRRQGIGYVPEELPRPRGWTVENFLRAGALLSSVRGSECSEAVSRVREVVGIGICGPLSHLSKGAMRRVAMAFAIVGRPALLLLDEPESGLDPEGRADLLETLGKLRRDGCTIVVASHDRVLLDHGCDRVLGLTEV